MPQPRSELVRPGLPLWAAAFVGMACAALIGLSAWHQWIARQNDLRSGEADLANLARSLTQHATDTFELADNMVNNLVKRIENAQGPNAIDNIQQFLQLPRDETRAPGIVVMDETGRWIATSEKLDRTGRNNWDREYFQHHRNSTSSEPYVGQPVKGRVSNKWTATISRRVNHRNGSFAGVVVANIEADYFVKYYQQFDVGKSGVITLFDRGGRILARSQDNDAFIGNDLSSSTVFRERAVGRVLYFRSARNGVENLSFFEESRRYPLIVVATMAKEEVLASWWSETMMQVFFVCFISALIALMGTYLVRRLMERQRMAMALVAKEADFRLLAEQSSDVVMRIGLDENIIYASPSCTNILGRTPEQLRGTSALVDLHEDDLPRARDMIATLKSGTTTEARMSYRKRHATKGEIWLETALRATQDPATGAIDGIVGICRDVTEQKNIEQRLDALARFDSLTGLANRRQFDETLATEWARAKRENTELGMLLLDVDHFKRYNDIYGHQAGDDCLRTVALGIADHSQRAADLASRYGGEEFSLLLPNTDKEGCRRIAEKIRNALYEAKIDHAGNEPIQRVTISIGCATVWPASVTTDSSALLEQADAALYLAKRSGRNQVCVAGRVGSKDTAFDRARSAV